MAYTIDDLTVLKEALVSGASQVTIGNRTIIFRSKTDLLELIRMIEGSLSDDDITDSGSVVIAGFDKKGV